jgi:antitoxin HigA-1
MSISRIITEMSRDSLLAGLAPTHPGEILREEILPALGFPKTEIARRLGVSRQTLYDLIAERQPVTPAMALRLGKLFGNTPEFWLNLQRDYDLRLLEGQMENELAKITTVRAA